MKIKAGSYLLIVIMAAAVAAIILSAGMTYPTAKILPFIIGGIILILGTVLLVREQRKQPGPEAKAAEGKESSRLKTQEAKTQESGRGYLTVGGWVAAFVLSIYLLGFIISVAVFCFSYMKLHGMKWFVAITFALVTTAICYAAFELLMKSELYRGLIFMQLTG